MPDSVQITGFGKDGMPENRRQDVLNAYKLIGEVAKDDAEVESVYAQALQTGVGVTPEQIGAQVLQVKATKLEEQKKQNPSTWTKENEIQLQTLKRKQKKLFQ
jgi:hypothetical protein